MATNKTPAWVWIGCGCLLAIFGLVAVIGGTGFAGFKFFQGMVEDMADPVARTEAVLDILGAETLPDGWHARVFFRIPFLMTIVILTDGDPPEAIEGDLEQKAESLEQLAISDDQIENDLFLYGFFRGRGPDSPETFEEVLSGEAKDTDVNLGLEIGDAVTIDEGEMQVGDQAVRWRASRGRLDTRGDEIEGLWATFAITCPDGEFHEALWFHRMSAEAPSSESTGAEQTAESATASSEAIATETGAEFEIEGTPADPKEIERVLGYFDLCS